VDLGPLQEDEEEVEFDASMEAPPPKVFMPPGDMDAARRMAVVYIDNPPPFLSTAAAIAEAISVELPGLHVTMVPSSLGDMYAKFLSVDDRQIAIDQQPFFLDGATVRLVREEEADHVPCDMQFIAVILARRMPVEHLSSLGVHSAFACFGQTLEVDISGLAGTDVTTQNL
jgi:hypothetical protein